MIQVPDKLLKDIITHLGSHYMGNKEAESDRKKLLYAFEMLEKYNKDMSDE